MIYHLRGTIRAKREQFVVIDAGPFAFKVFVSPHTLVGLPAIGAPAELATNLYWREGAGFELYGFLAERERDLFERLIGISGVGPKSALAIMGVAPVNQLIAAINEGRAEFLTRASGIGRKTAERIILELKGKFEQTSAAQTLELMESDAELEDTLVALGFSKSDARAHIGKLDPKIVGFKERLKAALKKER